MAQRTFDVEGPWDQPMTSDYKLDFKKQQDALAELKKVSDAATVESPVGFILSFPVADGHALYRVEQVKPTVKVAHIPFLDGYQIPDAHLRGLRVSDVNEQIGQRDFWNGMAQGNLESV